MDNEYQNDNRQWQNQEPLNQEPLNQEPPVSADNSGAYQPGQDNSQGAYRYTGREIPDETRSIPYGYRRPAGSYQETNSGYGQNARFAGQSGYEGREPYGAGAPGGYNTQNPYARPGSGGEYRSAASGYENPMSGYNVKPETPKKKKSGGGKKIIAAAVICALLGGIGGGAAVGLVLRGSGTGAETPVESAAEAVPETEDEKTPASASGETLESSKADKENINSTVIDVKTNSETTEMTPQNVYEQYVNAVVAISNEQTVTNIWGQYATSASSGSGFIISEDGYIVTNNHVVAGAEKLTVMMTSGEEYDAELIGTDAENDVALIKIDAEGLPTVSVGSSTGLQVGQQVCAIGNPLGELTNTLTVGYVSALDREISDNGSMINMFQTDCAINAGNSGGPIFDMHGNVIGITTAKYSSSGSSYSASIEGIGFCIPIDDAMDIVSDLLEYGYVKGRPSLGITCGVVDSSITQYYHLPQGITVMSVQEGSAAENAGLQEGDIITAVDGTEVASVSEFKALLKNYSAGDSATLSVYRSESAKTMEVTIVFDEKTMSAPVPTSAS